MRVKPTPPGAHLPRVLQQHEPATAVRRCAAASGPAGRHVGPQPSNPRFRGVHALCRDTQGTSHGSVEGLAAWQCRLRIMGCVLAAPQSSRAPFPAPPRPQITPRCLPQPIDHCRRALTTPERCPQGPRRRGTTRTLFGRRARPQHGPRPVPTVRRQSPQTCAAQRACFPGVWSRHGPGAASTVSGSATKHSPPNSNLQPMGPRQASDKLAPTSHITHSQPPPTHTHASTPSTPHAHAWSPGAGAGAGCRVY